ncbi:MAG: DUF4198 domain-containing protein [Longimicrobiales bacterium]|nr:DUF4198 domain-containing protein [Longimicrobiales bacterium]
MNRLSRGAVLALAALASAASLVAGHDLFIKMDSYFLPPDTPVKIPIVNGTFMQSENSITTDRVTDASVVHQGQRRVVGTADWSAETDTTYLGLRTGAAGTYVVGVSTLPRQLGLDAGDFNQYLASDGVIDVLKQRALDKALDQGAWEQYSKHVKAVFQVGDRRTGGLDVALGYPAELIPMTNPYELEIGGEMAVRALVDGRTVAGQLVIAGGDGGGHGAIPEREARTDAQGVARFRLDRPGRWYVKFINMVPTEAEGLDYESKWATLTFEIR